MLSPFSGGGTPLPGKLRELLAPVGEVAEPVETGARGREKDDVPLPGMVDDPLKRVGK